MGICTDIALSVSPSSWFITLKDISCIFRQLLTNLRHHQITTTCILIFTELCSCVNSIHFFHSDSGCSFNFTVTESRKFRLWTSKISGRCSMLTYDTFVFQPGLKDDSFLMGHHTPSSMAPLPEVCIFFFFQKVSYL